MDRRGGHSPGGAVVTEASRAGATVAAPAPENRTPLLIPKKDRGIIGWIWWLREVPLMAISTGLVAHVANPAAACLVFCVGLLRLLLMALERRVADVSINADEGAVNTVHHSAEGGPAGLGASHRPQEAEGTVPHQSTTAIMGLWCKDNQASEPMGEAMDLVRLNPLIRRAVGLVNGLEIRVTPEEFSMSVLCAIPWFKVLAECCPLCIPSSRTFGPIRHFSLAGDGGLSPGRATTVLEKT